jgi:hypothetical protein
MNVICVTEKDFTAGGVSKSGIKVGDVHEVVCDMIGIDNSGARIPCYKLVAFINTSLVHDQRNFARLSDLDETELVTEEFEEKYCVPVNR